MKIVLIVGAVVVVAVLGVVIVGALLPKRHVSSRSALFTAAPERLFALISGSQDWRPDVKSCELIQQDGKSFQRETSKSGETILYELQDSRPPFAIQRHIVTENLPYGGTWTFVLAPPSSGSGDHRTMVRITEDGEIYNPVFRFVSKFIMGQTASQDAYLKAMGKAVGEEVRAGN